MKNNKQVIWVLDDTKFYQNATIQQDSNESLFILYVHKIFLEVMKYDNNMCYLIYKILVPRGA